MGTAIALRGDFDGPGLRRLAKAAKDAGQGRRCLALAEIYDGGARWDAARMSGVGLSGDPGLGAAFQWLWAERTDRPQGIGPGAQARRRATPGACTGGRERADPGDPCKCLEFHYTPKHASWLNMVEIEIGVLRGQCLDRRIANRKRLVSEIAAWQHQRNYSGARIKWMFTID